MNVPINDAELRGKFRITKKDILQLLPEEVKQQITGVNIRINNGLPHWVLSTNTAETFFVYVPFSGCLEKVSCIRFGKILLFRKGRYLRDQYHHKGTDKKVYTVYLCRRNAMYLWREVKEYWFDDGDGLGCAASSKWFRAFP